jgi:hypothetical protein
MTEVRKDIQDDAAAAETLIPFKDMNIPKLEYTEENLRVVCTGLHVLKQQKADLIDWIRNYHADQMKHIDEEFKAGKTLLSAEQHEMFIFGQTRRILNNARSDAVTSTRNSWAVSILKLVHGDEKYNELSKRVNSSEETPKKKKRAEEGELASGGNGEENSLSLANGLSAGHARAGSVEAGGGIAASAHGSLDPSSADHDEENSYARAANFGDVDDELVPETSELGDADEDGGESSVVSDKDEDAAGSAISRENVAKMKAVLFADDPMDTLKSLDSMSAKEIKKILRDSFVDAKRIEADVRDLLEDWERVLPHDFDELHESFTSDVGLGNVALIDQWVLGYVGKKKKFVQRSKRLSFGAALFITACFFHSSEASPA